MWLVFKVIPSSALGKESQELNPLRHFWDVELNREDLGKLLKVSSVCSIRTGLCWFLEAAR